MTPDQLARVRATWAHAARDPAALAALLHERLAALDPALGIALRHRPARSGAVDAPAVAAPTARLVAALDALVASLDDPARRPAAGAALVRRVARAAHAARAPHAGAPHAGAGDPGAGRARTCAALCAALSWTLAHQLGPAWDVPARAAWRAAYDALATAVRGRAPLAPAPRTPTLRTPALRARHAAVTAG